jgi:Flp pilus assembly protein TadG
MTRRARDDRGTASGELVVLASLSFVFVAAIVFAGRINISAVHVEGAARAAARALSLARDPADVVEEARDEAEDAVGLGTPLCRSMDFSDEVTTSPETGFRYVTVEITCEVDLAQASLVGVPASLTVHSSASEVIDRYRERSAVATQPGRPGVAGGDPGEVGRDA